MTERDILDAEFDQMLDEACELLADLELLAHSIDTDMMNLLGLDPQDCYRIY